MSAAAGPRLAVTAAADDLLDRRDRFEADHPDITIMPPETHASKWTARRGGRIMASGYQLGGLLDVLERLAGESR